MSWLSRGAEWVRSKGEGVVKGAVDIGKGVVLPVQSIGAGVVDVVEAPFVNDEYQGFLGTIYDVATKRGGEALSEAFGRDSGVGAAFRALPEPVRAPVRTVTQPVLSGSERLYNDVISRPIATALTAASLADAERAKGNESNVQSVLNLFNGDNWREAWDAADNISPGQAFALAMGTKDITDPVEVQRFAATDHYKQWSSMADAVLRVNLDPTVVAGKVGAGYRAGVRAVPLTQEGIIAARDSTRVNRFVNRVDDIVTQHGKGAADRIQSEMFPNHAEGAYIADLLANAPDTVARRQIVGSMMGSAQDYESLYASHPDVAHQIRNLTSDTLDAVEREKGLLRPGRAEMLDAEAQALYPEADRLAKIQATYASLDEIPNRSYLSQARAGIATSSVYQKSPLTAPLRTISNMLPQHWVNLNDNRSHIQAGRILQQSRLPVERQAELSSLYMGAVDTASRQRILVQIEEEAVQATLEHYGAPKEMMDDIIRSARRGREEAMGALSRRKYDAEGRGSVWVGDEVTGERVHLPLHVTQQANLMPTADLAEVERAAQAVSALLNDFRPTPSGIRNEYRAMRLGASGSRTARRVAAYTDLPAEAMEGFYAIWRPATLLRAGWPARILTDEQLRILSKIGAMAQIGTLAKGAVRDVRQRLTPWELRTADGEIVAGRGLPNIASATPEQVAAGIVKRGIGDYETTILARTGEKVTLPPAFGTPGDAANYLRSLNSSSGTFRGIVMSDEAGILRDLRKGTGEWRTIAHDAEDYGAAWEGAVNKQIRQSAFAREALKGKSVDELVDWLAGRDKITIAETRPPTAMRLPVTAEHTVRPLGDYVDTLFRESSADDLVSLLGTGTSAGQRGSFFASTPDLALGQARNTGVRIEVDARQLRGFVNRSKPGWEFAYENGAAELMVQSSGQQIFDALRRVEMSKADVGRWPGLVSSLEDRGFHRVAMEDGRVAFVHPSRVTVTEAGAEATDALKVGQYVKAGDRQNFGRIVSLNDDGTAQVHFVNKTEGSQATVTLRQSELTARSGSTATTATMSGPEYARAMGWSPATFEKHAADVAGQINSYVPTEGLRSTLLERNLSYSDLKNAVRDSSKHPAVHGELMQALGTDPIFGHIRTIRDGLFKWLGQVPTDVLSRNPFFDAMYRREGERLINVYAGAGRLTPEAIEEIATKARHFALNESQSLLYDLAEKSKFAHMLRFISPFYMAFQEVLTRWAGIAVDNPAFVARTRLVWNSPEKAGLVTDEHGYRIDENGRGYDPITDEQVPKDLVGGDRYVTLPFGIPGLSTHGPVKLNKKSMNIALQGFSFGPPVAVAVNEIVKDKPNLEDVVRWALPYGPVQNSFSLLLPASAKRAYALAQKEDDRQYANSLLRIYFDRMTDYQLGKRKDKPTYQEAKRDADALAKVRVGASWILPFAPIFDSPYQPYISAYRNAQERLRTSTEAGNDAPFGRHDNGAPVSVDEWFLDAYGEEYFWLTQSLSRSNDGVQPTKEGFQARERYKDLIEAHPDLGSVIIGNEGAGEYSAGVYQYQLAHETRPGSGVRQRSGYTFEEGSQQPEVRLGWIKYGQAMDVIEVERTRRGLPNLNVRAAADLAETKRQITESLKAQYPAWGEEFATNDSDKWTRRLDGLRDVAADPRLNRGDRPDIAGLREYLRARDVIVSELANRPSHTLTSAANQDLAQTWDSIRTAIVEQHVAFAPIFYRYLERDPLEAENG